MLEIWIVVISKDQRSKEYEGGVEYFISFAIQNSTSKISIRCPCIQCGNLIFHTPQIIREHLFFYGFDQVTLHGIGMGKQVQVVDQQLPR